MQTKLLGIIVVDFDLTGQLLIIYSAFNKYFRKKGEYNETVYPLYIDFRQFIIQLREGSCIKFSMSLVSP